MEKDLKKKKGMMKEQAQKKYDDMVDQFEKEVTDFDAKNAAKIPSEKGKEVVPDKSGPEKMFSERNWNTLSKTQMEEECSKRGLSKKGSKEQLTTRLILFSQEQRVLSKHKKAIADDESDKKAERVVAPKPAQQKKADKKSDSESGSDSDDDRHSKAKKPAPPKREEESESSSDEESKSHQSTAKKAPPSKLKERDADRESPAARKSKNSNATGKSKGRSVNKDDSSDSDSDDSNEDAEEKKAEAAAFAKREQVVQQKLAKVLQQNPEGIDVDAISEQLEQVGVKNFRPDVVGYATLHEFCNSQPQGLLTYDPVEQKIYPGKRR